LTCLSKRGGASQHDYFIVLCVCVGIGSCLISSCLQETFGGGGVFDLLCFQPRKAAAAAHHFRRRAATSTAAAVFVRVLITCHLLMSHTPEQNQSDRIIVRRRQDSDIDGGRLLIQSLTQRTGIIIIILCACAHTKAPPTSMRGDDYALCASKKATTHFFS
jgi:hypothetical protein